MKKIVSFFLVIILSFLLLVTLIGCSKSPNLNLVFNEENKFRILQLTDMQYTDEGITDSSREILNVVIDESDPNFIVVTGDLFSTELFKDGKVLEKIVKDLAKLLNGKKIPFTITFGNHDALFITGKSAMTKLEILEIFMNCEYFIGGLENNAYARIFINNDDSYTNYSIPIKDNTGKTIFNVITLDTYTASAPIGKPYRSIDEKQTEFYVNESQRLYNENNNSIVPIVLFTHIQLPEIIDMFNYRDDESIVHEFKGEIIEGVPNKIKDWDIFSGALALEKNLACAFVGHYHYNSFAGIATINDHTALYGFGRNSSYADEYYPYGYKDKNYPRGGRIIELEINGNLRTVECIGIATNNTYTKFTYEEINEIYFDRSK